MGDVSRDSRLKTWSKAIWQGAGISALLAFPVATAVSGGAKLSSRAVDPQTCVVRHEFSFLGILAFRYESFDKRCAEAQAVLAILNGGISLDDTGMVATALTTFAAEYPELGPAFEKTRKDLLDRLRDRPPKAVPPATK